MSPPVFYSSSVLNRYGSFRILGLALIVFLNASVQSTFCQSSNTPNDHTIRSVIIELYVADGDSASEAAVSAARKIAKSRNGIRLAIRKIGVTKGAEERLEKIADYFKFDPTRMPIVYCCNQVILNKGNVDEFKKGIESALQIEVFVRKGCPHCDAAKKFLPKIEEDYPGFKVVTRDILETDEAKFDLNALVRKHRAAAVSMPVFNLCNSLIVGFDRESTTGARIRKKLDRWTIEARKKSKPKPAPQDNATTKQSPTSKNTAPEVAFSLPFPRNVSSTVRSTTQTITCSPVLLTTY